MKPETVIHFSDAFGRFLEAQELYSYAASMLASSVEAVISIVDDGGDPKKAIETLKPYLERFNKVR